MPRRITFSKYEANKSLYNYNDLQNLSDDNCYMVFLSPRDLGIIYEAIEYANVQQTRVLPLSMTQVKFIPSLMIPNGMNLNGGLINLMTIWGCVK